MSPRLLVGFAALLLTVAAPAFGDGPPPGRMLGVCKVRLVSGREFEGVIVVSQGGPRWTWDPNGFYQIIDSIKEKVTLFDGSFHGFVPQNGLVSETLWPGHATSPDIYTYRTRTYFMQDMHGNYEPKVRWSRSPDSADFLYRDITHFRRFRLLDYVPVYRTVPANLYPNYEKWSEILDTIPIADIAEFSLLTRPSQDWLLKIAVAESAYWANNTDDPDDTPPPAWYHHVVSLQVPTFTVFFTPWDR